MDLRTTRISKRRKSSWLATVLVLAVGCGSDGENPAPPLPEPSTVTARLELEPPVVNPGETVEVTVENDASTRLSYGLGVMLFRAEDGSWNNVPLQINVPYILLSAEPESAAGPRYPGRLVDSFRAPAELPEGRYLVSKSVTSSKRETVIYGAFDVPAGD